MRLLYESDQRAIDAKLDEIRSAGGSGMATVHDKETGSLITALVVDGELAGWTITGPFTPCRGQHAERDRTLRAAVRRQRSSRLPRVRLHPRADWPRE